MDDLETIRGMYRQYWEYMIAKDTDGLRRQQNRQPDQKKDENRAFHIDDKDT